MRMRHVRLFATLVIVSGLSGAQEAAQDGDTAVILLPVAETGAPHDLTSAVVVHLTRDGEVLFDVHQDALKKTVVAARTPEGVLPTTLEQLSTYLHFATEQPEQKEAHGEDTEHARVPSLVIRADKDAYWAHVYMIHATVSRRFKSAHLAVSRFADKRYNEDEVAELEWAHRGDVRKAAEGTLDLTVRSGGLLLGPSIPNRVEVTIRRHDDGSGIVYAMGKRKTRSPSTLARWIKNAQESAPEAMHGAISAERSIHVKHVVAAWEAFCEAGVPVRSWPVVPPSADVMKAPRLPPPTVE